MSEHVVKNENVGRLIEVLENLGYVTVVRVAEADTQVRLLCRVSNKKAWCTLLEKILQEAFGSQLHVCQQYFLKEKALVFGWNFIITASDPNAVSKAVCASIAAPEIVEVDTFPLRGALRPPANSVFNPRAPGLVQGGASHKGVFPVGGKG